MVPQQSGKERVRRDGMEETVRAKRWREGVGENMKDGGKKRKGQIERRRVGREVDEEDRR